jgi:methyl-accepting chemotaxis protein
MNLAKMKVGTRLSLGFGLVMTMMVALGATGLLALDKIGTLDNKIIDEDLVKAKAASAIDVRSQENGKKMTLLFVVTDKEEAGRIYKEIDANRKAISESIAMLDEMVATPEGRALLAKIKVERERYVTSFDQVRRLLEEGKRDEALKMFTTATMSLLEVLQDHIDELSKFQEKRVDINSAGIRQSIKSASLMMSILGLFALFIGVAASILITRGLLKQLGGEPDYAAAVAGEIAGGNLAVAIDTRQNDSSSLLFAIKSMRDSLANIVGEVRVCGDSIAVASGQIASGNSDLSSRTEQQAGALEETASSLEELTVTVKQNADNAHQANQLALSASDVAVKGGAVVSQVVDTMNSINDASRKIVDIISVIDGIAFQTNILALNAAVEAARAGEQGRGFAVVASEVRSLAQRSAGAAKEIKTLINDSVETVETGAKLVKDAGSTMEELVSSVRRVTDIMSEITSANREQAAGIEQINQAVSQMDQVTQQNAALVEEAAAAAHAMQERAGDLTQAVSLFTLDSAQGKAACDAAHANAQIIPFARDGKGGHRLVRRSA